MIIEYTDNKYNYKLGADLILNFSCWTSAGAAYVPTSATFSVEHNGTFLLSDDCELVEVAYPPPETPQVLNVVKCNISADTFGNYLSNVLITVNIDDLQDQVITINIVKRVIENPLTVDALKATFPALLVHWDTLELQQNMINEAYNKCLFDLRNKNGYLNGVIDSNSIKELVKLCAEYICYSAMQGDNAIIMTDRAEIKYNQALANINFIVDIDNDGTETMRKITRVFMTR
jgi:hypothetical protein